jgi:DNA polymerase III subunit delta
MPKPIDALDYLAKPAQYPAEAVCVVHGDEPFLARQVVAALRGEVLGAEDAEFSLSVFEGPTTLLRDVLDELATVAMFGGGRRLVVVEDADTAPGRARKKDQPTGNASAAAKEDDNSFVSRYRPELEDYVARPTPGGVLVLVMKSFPSNTRLYKAVAASGLVLNASAPPPAKLGRWVIAWAKQAHQAKIAAPAADVLVEMVGPELGLIDQELAKMALSVGPGGQITPEVVARMVGSWRAKKTWDMLDAALDGNTPEALDQLDRLLLAGEAPISILAQISASLRRLAAATRLILKTEAAGRRPVLSAALEQVGVKRFVLDKTQRQLRQLGRHRGAQLYRALLQADLDLKGASDLPPRLVLEKLLFSLSAKDLKTAGR